MGVESDGLIIIIMLMAVADGPRPLPFDDRVPTTLCETGGTMRRVHCFVYIYSRVLPPSYINISHLPCNAFRRRSSVTVSYITGRTRTEKSRVYQNSRRGRCGTDDMRFVTTIIWVCDPAAVCSAHVKRDTKTRRNYKITENELRKTRRDCERCAP